MFLRTKKAIPLLLSCLFAGGLGAETRSVPIPGTSGLERRETSLKISILPLIFPLEATIGKLYIGRNDLFSIDGIEMAEPGALSRPFSSADLRAEKPLYIKELQIAGKGAYYRKKEDIGLLLKGEKALLDFNLTHFTGMLYEDFRNGDALSGKISFGYGFGRKEESLYSPVHVLLGFTSSYFYPDRSSEKKISGTEYGEVFFSPGLQITKSSVMFHAMVELPVFHTKLETLPPDREDQIRANFGMKYYLR